ncbi:EAL domain-containing protein [Bacillus songklensis]|uniref:EAL domain-containing protein n=1 Tax=Bacillus songklensis TaxID=1069116 RepID=A0ABV8AWA6_9BACI
MTENNQIQKLKDDFNHTVKNLQNGVFKVRKDENGNFIYTMSEGKLLNQLGINTEILFNKAPNDVFSPEIAAIKHTQYEKAFNGNRVNYEIELSGRLLFIDLSPIEQGNEVVEIVGSVHDVTELKSIQRRLLENQLLYQSLFEHSQSAVISFDHKGNIINMNPKAKELLGYSFESLQKTSTTDIMLEEYRDIRRHCFEKALKGEPQSFDTVLINGNGQKIHLNLTYFPIIVDNEINAVYSIGKDITEQKKLQELNAYLAYHDELTKLPNRRWFEEKLHESLTFAEQNKQKLAVMFIDLDRFKHINDTLGHFIGDRLLEQVSFRLKEIIKGNRSVARMGGDEFMVLCPVIEHPEEPVQMAKILLNRLRDPFYIEDFELIVTASIGISVFPTGGENVIELMKNADIALYRAKDQGRNTYQIYSTSIDVRSYQSFFLERDLRKALNGNEFMVYLQPRVDAKTGKIISAEALIRWNHPKLGLVPPSEFIPLAEETGLIIPIGQWMKKRVCEQLVAWREAGIPLIPVSINISAQRFLQKDFTKNVRQLLDEYRVDGNFLEFEITENSLMKIEDDVIQTIKELKDLGIKIYMDDFGTGYSSFAYLKSIKLDGIKIDRSFIRNISSESENAGITTAMITMAKHLKMDVIAEGVETEEELRFLRKQNCHHIQGFLFSKPCPIEEFEQMLIKGEISRNSIFYDSISRTSVLV